MASLHVWKARIHYLESEKATLKSLALILTGKGPTHLKEVLEFFVKALVGAKLLEMAMARIFFFDGRQPRLMPPVNKRRIAVAHPWRSPPEKIYFLGTLNNSSFIGL